MFQLVTWTALDQLGLGGTVQHYNPLVDAVTADTFGISKDWQLVAQMPFGNPVDEHTIKEKSDVKAKVFTF